MSMSAFAVLAGTDRNKDVDGAPEGGDGTQDGGDGTRDGCDGTQDGGDGENAAVVPVSAPFAPVFKDITERMRRSCASLGVGGILMAEGFTLHDSMSALELFSPKMDSGMNMHEVMGSVKERCDKGQLRVPPLNDLELVTICDLIATMEVAFYNGHSLATSVHSCVFLSQDAIDMLNKQCNELAAPPQQQSGNGKNKSGKGGTGAGRLFRRIKRDDSDELVLSFVTLVMCLGIINTCGAVRAAVQLADIYEEEDFSPSHLGLPLAAELSFEDVIQLFDSASEALAVRRDKLFAQKDSTKQNQNEQVFSLEGCGVLLEMLAFRKAYRTMLWEMNKPDCAGIGKARVAASEAAMLWEAGAGPGGRTDTSTLSSAMQQARRRCQAVKGDNDDEADCYLVLDPDVNRSIIAASPPRARPSVDLAAAHANITKLLCDVEEVCDLDKQDNLLGLFNALIELSALEPNIVARSLAVPMLYGEGKLALGKYEYRELIAANMRNFGIPAMDVSTDSCRNFCETMIKPVYDVLRMLTANTARQRRNIANLLPDWSLVQQEAEIQDQLVLFESRPDLAKADLGAMSQEALAEVFFFSLLTWSTEWTTRLLLRHVELGFGLELYAPQEMEIMTWYYAQLSARLTSNREDMFEFFSRRYLEAKKRATDKTLDAAEKKKVKKEIDSLTKQQAALRKTNVVHENFVQDIHRVMSEGLLRALIALRMQGKLPISNFEFGSEEIRYNHRVASYSAVFRPPLLTYASYASVSDASKYEVSTLLDHAKTHFDRCREVAGALIKQIAGSDTKEDKRLVTQLRAFAKVAIMNSMMAGQEKAAPKDDTKVVVIDVTTYLRSPIIKLVKKQEVTTM